MTRSLPKTFDPADIEARWYAHWETNGLFRPERPDAQPFTIVNPPPNVTGSLHIGHALDNTLQDVVVRYERLRGKDALWVVGTDHAGIATQMVVEREMELRQDKRTNYTREDFVAKVWEWKHESGGTITRQLRRLGCSMDWSREQFTMDPHFTRAVIKVFVDLYNQGLLYRDKRLVNWDPKLKTAISDLEVDNREVPGHMWHFKYPLEGGRPIPTSSAMPTARSCSRNSATTSPSPPPGPRRCSGDGAVAVHPGDARYAPIVGKLCEIPGGPKEQRRLIPIITDDYPDPDFGSGAVKITGRHDANDYGVARRNGIPMYRLMDEAGHMRARRQLVCRGRGAGARDRHRARPRRQRVDALNWCPKPIAGSTVTRHARGGCRHRRRRADARHRGQDHRAAVRRPRRRGDRADADRPVVRRCRQARRRPHRGGARRADRDRAEELGEDLVQLDGEHPALVRQPPAVVGATDSPRGTTRTARSSSPTARRRRRRSPATSH
jgi:valyl-tRNA synthetase